MLVQLLCVIACSVSVSVRGRARLTLQWCNATSRTGPASASHMFGAHVGAGGGGGTWMKLW